MKFLKPKNYLKGKFKKMSYKQVFNIRKWHFIEYYGYLQKKVG